MNPMLFKDFYKADHRSQYPTGTSLVYANFTPRKSRNPYIREVVFFGIQAFIKEYLLNRFSKDFFDIPKEQALESYRRIIDSALGKGTITYEHVEALWELGYLPIKIKALPEGTRCPIGVPVLTIVNTLPEFFWVTNFLETILSAELWGPTTSATTAYEYRKLLNKYATETTGSTDFVQWQGHDFGFRGMFGLNAACMSGAGHLLSFTGTDTIPAISWLEQYYNADCEKELVGGSVPASEHSVQCMGGPEGEFDIYERMITEVYPKGIVSLVSDTYDLWNVITNYLPRLKSKIMARDGKLVIRPDSGDPVDIICGTLEQEWSGPIATQPNEKGVIQLLWEIFGGTVTPQGYKVLDPHIGAIYGDSITLERANSICERLKQKGFASTNIVLGIGSFTYQYVTRDSFGFAMKATYGEVNGVPREIFKDPKTDSGMKKSLKGLLVVYNDGTSIKVKDQCTKFEETEGLLETVFENGKLIKDQSLSEIRNRLWTT
jgi:nicotinamide phosphoribosyltransferase